MGISRSPFKVENPSRGKTMDIWGFGHREKYVNRLKIPGVAAPSGPYKVERIRAQKISHADRSSEWNPPYLDDLRKLALSYWVGSEFDIALIKKERRAHSKVPRLVVYHAFNALTNNSLCLKYGFEWDREKHCHLSCGNVNFEDLVKLLLTYYNAVFYDDVTADKSRAYYHYALPMPVAHKIKICRAGEEPVYFFQDEEQCFRLEHLRYAHSLPDRYRISPEMFVEAKASVPAAV